MKISDEARALGQLVYEEMFQRLMAYGMHTMKIDDDRQRGYPLIDFLSAQRGTETGKHEIEMIVDDVANSEIDTILQRALDAARDQALDEVMQAVHLHHPNEKAILEAIRAMKVKS